MTCQKTLWLGFSYGLVTEQKKGVYKYFIDLGDRMEVVTARTVYVDQVCLNVSHFFSISQSLG